MLLDGRGFNHDQKQTPPPWTHADVETMHAISDTLNLFLVGVKPIDLFTVAILALEAGLTQEVVFPPGQNRVTALLLCLLALWKGSARLETGCPCNKTWSVIGRTFCLSQPPVE